jgi:hypothetical protein
VLLVVAALIIGYDGWRAWQRQRPTGEAVTEPAPAPSPS